MTAETSLVHPSIELVSSPSRMRVPTLVPLLQVAAHTRARIWDGQLGSLGTCHLAVGTLVPHGGWLCPGAWKSLFAEAVTYCRL